mgnify:CR=1 FL=1
MSATSDMIRKMFGEADAKRDAGLTTPEDILRYDDICYGTDAKWQVLDVYRPKNREGERLPVIVSVHGTLSVRPFLPFSDTAGASSQSIF